MAVRHSEFKRKPDDLYVTPNWVWHALYKVEPWAQYAYDCAPIDRCGYNFLDDWEVNNHIASNPPYGRLAVRFVRHALDLPMKLNVAFLLPVNWDCAHGRRDLFTDPRFAAKYTLTKRILWDNIDHKPGVTPASNHAWFVWRPDSTGAPTMGWLP
jgi:hypothetical protein